MLSFIKGPKFTPADSAKSVDPADNPGRGWYRIYTYRLEEETWEDPVRYAGESLALVLFNVGAYKDEDLSSQALDRMDGILQRFEQLGFDLILRICYDTEGKGMVREPSLFSHVKKHVTQIAPLLKKHAASIYVYQGLLIGSWGEMHDSKFLSEQCLRELMELFLRETEGKIRLAIRKPVQWRLAFAEGEERGMTGFFNDGLLGSPSHLGTFGPETAGRTTWKEAWSPEEEARFMMPFTAQVPYGGEVIDATVPLSAEQVAGELRRLGTCYLNSTHDVALLTKWKEMPYGGQSLYDYVGRRLGYCFDLRKADCKVKKDDLRITIKIDNQGFGTLYDDADAWVFAKRNGQTSGFEKLGKLEGNLRGMPSGSQMELRGTFLREGTAGLEKGEELFLYVRILRRRDGKVISFARESQDGYLLLGTIK
ncbi:MAG: DUF4874 domain-containing protein [Lachnospiraceae bacterium]|nr:DUF4874 domain-containing protein [Lachnospiraceae bacterium]